MDYEGLSSFTKIFSFPNSLDDASFDEAKIFDQFCVYWCVFL